MVFISALSAARVLSIANTMFSGENGEGFSSADLDRTYIFNGTGNWDINTNWQYYTKPPVTLPSGAEIRVNPVGTTECILNTPQIIVPRWQNYSDAR